MSAQFFHPDVPQRWRYDVFLSFRGADTRRTFTSHLYHTLKERGVNVFMDDSLERGNDITTELIQTIRDSRISVVVFSRNYAESRWCLQELAEIMECRESSGQIVLPVFYDVNPSHVRRQTGCFVEAFQKHQEKLDLLSDDDGNTVLASWRDALTEAGNLSGWDLTNHSNGVEAKMIRDIVDRIWKELKHTILEVAKFPMGLESRVKLIIEQLNVEQLDDDVRFVGICGMGGIGKTTLAKAVYNQLIGSFKVKSFLTSVRDHSEEPNGLVRLQEQLLCDILNQKIEVSNLHRGVSLIKERLCGMRVFIVLDDVSDSKQLKVLARERGWFGPGSRIIVTTRNEDTLSDIMLDYKHTVEELNYDEAHHLFNLHAFGSGNPNEEFNELTGDVVTYCRGLPLAVEVLGSFLHGRSKKEWISALLKLEKIPHNEVHKQLKISYDALDDKEKEIFLNIACFFVGSSKTFTVLILDSCGLFGEIGISGLTRRSLLKLDGGKLVMHDLIRDMGREIVRTESLDNPGDRTRLWSYQDVMTTLRNHSGTIKVQGLKLVVSKKVVVDAASFTGMSKLKFLMLKNVSIRGKFRRFSRELRHLCWYDYPLSFMPDLHMENLVALTMRRSKLTSPWKAMQLLGELEILDLSHSCFLTKTPDFSRTPNLKRLSLEGCIKLKQIDGTIGQLERLVNINLKDCKELQSIPNSISKLKSLNSLDITGCSNLTTLPADIGEIKSLRSLIADGSGITEVPLSAVGLTNLKKLSMRNINTLRLDTRSSPAGIHNLRINTFSWSFLIGGVTLSNCDLSDNAFPTSMGSMRSLKRLDLSRNRFSEMPRFISSLPNLKELHVSYCTELQSLSDLPRSLHRLDASGCTTLGRLSLTNGALRRGGVLFLRNCSTLQEISGLDMWTVDNGFLWVLIRMEGCKNLSAQSKEQLTKDWRMDRYMCIPGSDIPDWVDCQRLGTSLSFQLPHCYGCKIRVLTLCFTYEPISENNNFGIVVCVRNKTTKMGDESRVSGLAGLAPFPSEDQIVICTFRRKESGQDNFAWIPPNHRFLENREVEVTIQPTSGEMHIKKLGVHLQIQACQHCRPSGTCQPSSSIVIGETV